jgi:hypothetical protein
MVMHRLGMLKRKLLIFRGVMAWMEILLVSTTDPDSQASRLAFFFARSSLT